MKILPAIHEARGAYVAFLKECLSRARVEHGEVAAEAIIKLTGPPEWSELQRTIRVDLMWNDAGEARGAKVELDGAVPGPAIGAMQVETLEVVVHPVAWHFCPVRFAHADPDFAPVDAWYRKWLGEGGGTPAEEGAGDELSGVVHSVSPPMKEGENWLLLVDFGSAPVEALADLLEALRHVGASDIKLGSAPEFDLRRTTLEAIAGEITPETFAAKLAQILRAELAAKVDIAGPMLLEVEAAEGARVRANLENLYRTLSRLDAAGRVREIGRWLEVHREQMARLRGESPLPTIDDLRPMVKDERFVDAVRAKLGPQTPSMWRRLAGDLWIVYVWDQPAGMQFLTNDDPGRHGLTPETLHARAVQNYLKARPKVDIEPVAAEAPGGSGGALLSARTGDNYDATLLLDDAFWRTIAPQVSGDVLACVPTRDVVLISGTAEVGGLAGLRRAARKLMDSGDHLVSATVLRRRAGKWELFAGPAPEETAPPAAPKKKRPWWKFW